MKKRMLGLVLAVTAIMSMPALADIDYSPPLGGFTDVVAYQPSDYTAAPAVEVAAKAVALVNAYPVQMVATGWPDGSGAPCRTKVTTSNITDELRNTVTGNYRPNNDGIGGGSSNVLATAYRSFEVGWQA